MQKVLQHVMHNAMYTKALLSIGHNLIVSLVLKETTGSANLQDR